MAMPLTAAHANASRFDTPGCSALFGGRCPVAVRQVASRALVARTPATTAEPLVITFQVFLPLLASLRACFSAFACSLAAFFSDFFPDFVDTGGPPASGS